MRPLLNLLVMPLLLVTDLAVAQQLIWSDPIVVHRVDQDPIRPRIVLNGDQRPVILWGEATPGANHVSIGEGNAFSAPISIHPADMHPTAEYWQGSDLTSQGNEMYVVMKMKPESSAGIYIVGSSDGGYTWSDTLRVDQVPGYKTRFSSIAMNGNGEALVQYMRIDMNEIEHRSMVSRIVNGTVQPPIDVSSPFTAGEDCDCCPGQILADGDRVVALFRDATENLRVIWAAASNNGGATFDQGAQIDPTDWFLNACPSSGPDGLIDGDKLNYVWMSGAVGGKKIYFGSAGSDDLGQIGTQQVHPDQPQNLQQDHPRIAGAGDTLGVVWQQSLSTQTEVLFSWRLPGEMDFNMPDTVNIELAGPQRSPDIAYMNGTFHLVWADHQENAVMYRTASIAPSIGIDENMIARIDLWPIPATDRLHIRLDDLPSDGMVQIFSVMGEIVQRSALSAAIDIPMLVPGVYMISVVDRNGSPLAKGKAIITR